MWRPSDALRLYYRGVEVTVQAFHYADAAQHKMKAKAIKLLKSKLWTRDNTKDKNHMFVYDLDDPYPEDLIRYRERHEQQWEEYEN